MTDTELIKDLTATLREAISDLNAWAEECGGEGFNQPRWNDLLARADARLAVVQSSATTQLVPGDRVYKLKDYKFPGVVLAMPKKLDGVTTIAVVECTAPDTAGMVRIFSPAQMGKSLSRPEPKEFVPDAGYFYNGSQ